MTATTYQVGPEWPGEDYFDIQLTATSGGATTTVPMYMSNPNGQRNVLAFSRNPLQRNSLKLYQGVQRYADLEPPWTPVAQTDWSGGKGSKDYDKDSTMYYDAYNVNTCRPGEIILGPEATETLTQSTFSNTAGTTYGSFTASKNDYDYFAYKFTYTGAGITGATLTINVNCGGYTGFYSGNLFVGIADKAAGTNAPENVTWSTNVYNGDLTYQTVTLNVAKALVNGTDYYITLMYYGANQESTGQYLKSTTAAGLYWTSETGANGAWSAGTATECPYFVVSAATFLNAKYNFFEYKGALYAVSLVDTGGTDFSKLYLNGDQGMCETTGTTTTIIKTQSGMKAWAADEAIGCILVLMGGLGDSQPQNWRPITDNDLAVIIGGGPNYTCSFTVDPPFDFAPDDTTQFAIVNSDDWTEIAGFDTSYNVRVRDVLSVNGSIYMACGDSTAMVAVRAYSNSGVWTYTYSGVTTDVAAETGQFTHLAYASDQAGTYVWGAKGDYPATIAYATAEDNTGFTGTNEVLLTFSSAINVGDLQSRIRGLEVYGDYGNMHVLKENGVYQIIDKKPYKIEVREMERTTDWRTGAAHTVHGVYLYFSWHDSVVRYYNGMLDRVGPDKAEVGWPTANRAGHFTSLVGYPGLVIGSVDAGVNGISSVQAYNGQGWCELYRTSSQRIQKLYIQSIPGTTADRLWISTGRTIVWVPISIDPFNHPDGSYDFATQGYLITAWYYLGLQTIDKLFNAIRLVIENTYSKEEWVDADYQKDDDSTWTSIASGADFEAFSEEKDLASTPSVYGKRIRFRFTLNSHDGNETPRIIASVMEMQ